MSQTKAQLINAKGDAAFDTNTLYVDAANNRIGVGTSSPNTKAHLYDSSNTALKIESTGANYVETNFINSSAAYTLGIRPDTSNSFCVRDNTASATRIVLDSSGRVGIGNTAPGNQSASASQLVVGNTSQNNGITILTGTANDGVLNFNDGDNNSVRGYVIYEHSTDSLRFASNGSERFRCDSSGRLLVGTSSNTAPAGNSSLIQIASTSFTAGVSIRRDSDDNAGPSVLLAKSRGSLNGNTVVQNGDSLGEITWWGADGTDVNSIGAKIECAVDGTPGNNDLPGRLVFSTTADGASSPTSRLVIKESGDIVIPSASATKGLWIGTGDAAGNSASANYRIGQNSTGVGSGTLYIGNAAIQVSSDARLKENIQDTTLSAVEELQKVRVVDFTWNDPSDTSYNNRNARGTWTGVIAQELVEIFPFAVNAPRKENDLSIDHDSDSTWTVEQQQLVPVLIKAIQEQQAVIAHLQSRVVVLETK